MIIKDYKDPVAQMKFQHLPGGTECLKPRFLPSFCRVTHVEVPLLRGKHLHKSLCETPTLLKMSFFEEIYRNLKFKDTISVFQFLRV